MKNDDQHRTLVESLRQRVPSEALSVAFSRSGGPGGQNVNKVNTRVAVMLALDKSSGLTVHETCEVRRQLRTRINREGRLVVVSWRYRTQLANRRAATDRLFDLLAQALRPTPPRRPTKIPRASRRRRLTTKRERGDTKRLRRRPASSDG